MEFRYSTRRGSITEEGFYIISGFKYGTFFSKVPSRNPSLIELLKHINDIILDLCNKTDHRVFKSEVNASNGTKCRAKEIIISDMDLRIKLSKSSTGEGRSLTEVFSTPKLIRRLLFDTYGIGDFIVAIKSFNLTPTATIFIEGASSALIVLTILQHFPDTPSIDRSPLSFSIINNITHNTPRIMNGRGNHNLILIPFSRERDTHCSLIYIGFNLISFIQSQEHRMLTTHLFNRGIKSMDSRAIFELSFCHHRLTLDIALKRPHTKPFNMFISPSTLFTRSTQQFSGIFRQPE